MAVAALFISGCILGSFLNVLIYRLPRRQSIIHPPSACPHCGARISPWDNIPVLSYIALGGRCRHCGARISPRYFVVEMLAGAIPALVYLRSGFGPELIVYWALSYVLLVVSFIDLDTRIIPDKVTIPGIVIGLVAAPILGLTTPLGSLLGAVAGGGGLYLVAVAGALAFKKESMGGGDIKLAAMLGAFLGWRSVLLLLFIAFLVGAVAGVFVICSRGPKADHRIPFGPFISLGALITIMWGDAIVAWYLMKLA